MILEMKGSGNREAEDVRENNSVNFDFYGIFFGTVFLLRCIYGGDGRF